MYKKEQATLSSRGSRANSASRLTSKANNMGYSPKRNIRNGKLYNVASIREEQSPSFRNSLNYI